MHAAEMMPISAFGFITIHLTCEFARMCVCPSRTYLVAHSRLSHMGMGEAGIVVVSHWVGAKAAGVLFLFVCLYTLSLYLVLAVLGVRAPPPASTSPVLVSKVCAITPALP